MNSYFEIQPLDYMLYMFLTCMPIFMPIGCNLSFDLWTHLLCIILREEIFIHFWERERKREREGEYKRLKFLNLGYHFEVESAIIFLWVQLFRNKDRPFLYRMYIKDFFLDCKRKVHLKNTKCYMFMHFFLFFFEF